ncbi:MAG: hypothetical protein COV46_07370 [Deltaproteobacteria bacterium CG11_big_fil_rev_8_21_14_0_20_49_13]|nr:MAG: hypothetical protein COV46_07370 [Deltaproteobacteria bacterium CG11_big_fil_rev_8_21_14_0_20_49_13]
MKNETKQLSVLHDLSRAIVGASRMEDVCQRILDRTVNLLSVSKASIMKIDKRDGMLKIVASKGIPAGVIRDVKVRVGEGISGKVFKSKKPIMIRDIKATGFEQKKRYKTSSLISTPVTCFKMKVGGKPVGVINVTDKKGGKHFTGDDLKLLNTIANQTASYLHLCDLAEDARESEHVMRELDLARAIQQRLLPQRIPGVQGLDIAGVCLTAEHVGGDYFDVIVGGARPPSVVVADVAGHSISAAMMMSAFRSALRSDNTVSLYSPAIIAERLNNILYDDLASAEQFISMVYLQVIPGGGNFGSVIKYTTAGHHPPLILKGNGFIDHSTEDILLGVERFPEYHERRIDVDSGNIIVLYTDGLVEAADKKGKRFGNERLRGCVRKNKHHSATKMVELLCLDVKEFIGKKPLADDVTVVIIKVK